MLFVVLRIINIFPRRPCRRMRCPATLRFRTTPNDAMSDDVRLLARDIAFLRLPPVHVALRRMTHHALVQRVSAHVQ